MDPALHELIRSGKPDDEVAVLLRLARGAIPAGVRVVARFGPIITARVARSAIPSIRAAEGVRSMKAPHLYGPDLMPIAPGEAENLDIRPTDERRPENLVQTGRGVIVSLVDWGLDVAHPDFRNEDGSTRILGLWDQRSRPSGDSNARYGYGWVHNRNAINAALRRDDPYAALAYHPADAGPGPTHGTHTTGIAAGNGRTGGPAGMAPDADIVFVHLATAKGERGDNLGDSVALLEAIDFIARVAGGRPWVLNLSMGRHAGPHDWSPLTVQGIDAALTAAPGRACVQSTGNYFGRPIHTQGELRPGEVRDIGFHTGEEDGFAHEIDIWYAGRDRVTVEVIAPSNELAGRALTGAQSDLIAGGLRVGRLYNRRRDPNNHDNEAHIYLDPVAPRGAWVLRLRGIDVVDGRFHCWVERDPDCSTCQPGFEPSDVVQSSTTGTICNGFLSIAVGAYDAHLPERPLSRFSSSGPTRDGRIKPDIVAPGVSILSARSARRNESPDDPLLARMSGTSMAAPYVAGTVALMFEAAGRLLPVRRTRELLLKVAQPVTLGEPQARWGSGYVEVVEAVAAAVEEAQMPVKRGSRREGLPVVEDAMLTADAGAGESAGEDAAYELIGCRGIDEQE
jgi:subtilisin family serine protease